MKVIQNAKERLAESPLWSAVASLMTGTVIARGLTVVASPILTRIYTPSEFGTLAVYVGMVSILATVVSLRYDVAIVLPESRLDGSALLVLSLLLAMAVSSVAALLLFVGRGALLPALGAEALYDMWWLVPLGLLAAGVYNALSYWGVRARSYAALARTKVAQGVGMLITQVGLGLAGIGPIGLLAGDVIGRSSGTLSLASIARNETIGAVRVGWRDLSRVILRYSRFPIYSMPSSVMNSAGLYAPPFIISVYYGISAAGWFALTQRVAGIGVALLGNAAGQAYLGEATQLARSNRTQMLNLYTSMAKRLALIGLVIFVPLATFAPGLFSLIFGLEWRPAGELVQVMAIFFVLQLIVSPLSQTLNILERQDWQLYWEGARMVLGLGGMLMSAQLGYDLKISLFTYAVGMSVTYALLYLMGREAICRGGNLEVNHG